jgi:cytochrome c biogenesis factor
VLLAIMTFGMSLIGTFLVRSGMLTSVHSFAVDPTRAVFILMLIGIVIGGGLILYAWRAAALASGNPFAPVSREGALVLNNLLFAVALAVWAALGALADLADRASVGTLSPAIVLRRLRHLSRGTWGITVSTAWRSERIETVHAGGNLQIAGRTLHFVGVTEGKVENY